MELERLIKDLQKQRTALDEIIARLVEVRASWTELAPRVKGRQGRKSMGMEERQVVAERMKNYWATRRQAKLGSTAGPPASPCFSDTADLASLSTLQSDHPA